MHERWTDRLSEYLDGEMDPPEARELEAHLAGCPSCAGVLDQLRGVVRRAREAGDPAPPRDLWPGIREGIGVTEGDVPVIELAPPRGPREETPGSRGGWRRSVRLTLPQLAAAGLVLALVSGGGAWALRGSTGPSPSGGEAGPSTPVPALLAHDETGAPASGAHAEEVLELEENLRTRRHLLEPRTVRILEKNLEVIDRAIRESRRALELDPGNRYLEEHLDTTVRRKLEYLRDAAATLEAVT